MAFSWTGRRPVALIGPRTDFGSWASGGAGEGSGDFAALFAGLALAVGEQGERGHGRTRRGHKIRTGLLTLCEGHAGRDWNPGARAGARSLWQNRRSLRPWAVHDGPPSRPSP